MTSISGAIDVLSTIQYVLSPGMVIITQVMRKAGTEESSNRGICVFIYLYIYIYIYIFIYIHTYT
jgi:hypothetical protein